MHKNELFLVTTSALYGHVNSGKTKVIEFSGLNYHFQLVLNRVRDDNDYYPVTPIPGRKNVLNSFNRANTEIGGQNLGK